MTHRRSGSWRGVLFLGALAVAFLFFGCDGLFDSDSSSSDGVSVPSASAPRTVSPNDFGAFSTGVEPIDDPADAEELILNVLRGFGGGGDLVGSTVSTSSIRPLGDNDDDNDAEDDELEFLLDLLDDYLRIEFDEDSFSVDSTESSFELDLAELDDELQGTLQVSDFSLRIRESESETETTDRWRLSLRSRVTVDMEDLQFEGEDDEEIAIPKGRVSLAANVETDERYNYENDTVSNDYALSLDAGIALTIENKTKGEGAHFLITLKGSDRHSVRNITYDELEDTIEERLSSRMNLRLRVYGDPNDGPLLDWDLADLLERE